MSKILADLGAFVIDADKVGHEIYLPGKGAWQQISAAFGQDILAEDQTIDRKKLGALVFNSADALKQLNTIVHPIMFKEIEQRIRAKRDERYASPIVVEAAILIEANWLLLADEVWVVVTDKNTVIDRVAEQRGMAPKDTEARIASQLSNQERLKYATVVIHNNGSLEDLQLQIQQVWGPLTV